MGTGDGDDPRSPEKFRENRRGWGWPGPGMIPATLANRGWNSRPRPRSRTKGDGDGDGDGDRGFRALVQMIRSKNCLLA